MNRSAARRLWIRRVGRASLMAGVLLFGLIGVQSVLAGGDNTTTTVSPDNNPVDFSTSVTFTAIVTDTDNGLYTPTGTVDFLDNGSMIDSETLDGSGQAQFTTSLLLAGSHPITVAYEGDDTAAPSTSTPPLAEVVDNAATTTALSTDGSPSVFGDTVTFTADVTSAGGTPTGSVDFEDTTTSTDLGSVALTAGTAQMMVSNFTVATHHITATYSGDTYFLTSGDALDQEVDPADTTTTITNDLSGHTDAGTAYNVAVEVDPILPGDGVPSGTVTVSDGIGETCPPITLTDGSGTCSMPNTTAGTKTITATYEGDDDFNGSVSSGTSHVVDPASTTTGLGSNHNPSVHGQAVKFTASVSGNPNAGTPTGTVDFKDGGTTIDSETLVAGMATFTTSTLTTASHAITVFYEGDSNYASSTSPLVTQVVNQAATTTTVISSDPTPPGPDPLGTSVTFTAHVVATAPGVGIPTGTVNFKSGGSTIGSNTLDGTGHTSFTTTILPVGAHTITAVYADDADFIGSTSPGITQTVGKATPTVSVSSGENPSVYGDDVTFSAIVTGSLDTPTGTVTFKSDGVSIGSDALDGGGNASVDTSTLDAGTYVITATYNGDGSYTSATSPALSGGQEVDPATLTVTTANKSRAYGAANPAFTVGYGGFVNGENLATSGVTGVPSCGTAATPTSSVAGSPYTITCAIGSLTATNYTFAFVSGQLTVTPSTSTTVVTADHHPSVWGQSVTFTATISGFGAGTATGTVNFVIDGTAPQGRTVSSDQATFTTSALAVGSHTVTANYLGDGNVNTSSGSLSGGQTVNKAASATSITTDLTPVTFVGDAYTVAVSVTATGLGAGTPTGSVTVSDATDDCVVTLSGGTGSCLLTSSTAGRPKTISAAYAGDLDFTGSADNATHIVDTPPVAAADTYTTNENGFVASALTTTAGTGVLSNDTDADSDPLTAVKISDPTNGTLTLNANGSFTYTPDALFIGDDSFTYAANDGFTDSTTATVTIHVTAVNQPPSFTLKASPNVTVAEDQYDSTAFTQANEAGGFVAGPPAEIGQTLLGFVISNNNHNLFAGSGQPAIDTSGTLTFKTFSNANGVATVTVRAQDSGGTANGGVDLSAAQTFTITVTPVNDAPTANGDLASVGQNSSGNVINVLANDVAGPPDEQPGGANAQTIKINSVTQPAHGHVNIVNSNSLISYTPTAGFVCPASTPQNCDTFTYTIIDNGSGPGPLTSAPGTVFLTVTPSVSRYSGADRYATGVAIVSANYGPSQPVIYVATGTNFPDGLAGGAAAGFEHAPLILINGLGSSLPANISTELTNLSGPTTRIVVLGGTGAINTTMFNLLAAKAGLLPDGHTRNITRLSDDNRYDTAVKVSLDTYPSSPASGAVFLASGLAFPDALSASAVAGHLGAPLLLVPGNQPNLSSVPKVTAELTRLAPTTIYIAGGTGAVSAGIQSALHTMFPLATIQRFAGANRYETATKIADFFFQDPAVPPFGAVPVQTVYVASGLNFPDALAGGALAGSQGAPLLLVPGTSPNIDGVVVSGHLVIKDEFGSTRLYPNRVVIFGGSGAVSNGIYNELVSFPKSS